MLNNYITVCLGKNKNGKLYIWPIFTCINRTFDSIHPIHINWLTLRAVRSRNSVYFAVRFTLSAKHSHIWWDFKNYTQNIIYALCAIEPSCLHSLKGHYPYNSINKHPCWNDSNYSYPSIIRRGTNVCDHSAIYRKLIAVKWVSDEQKNVSC